MKNLLEVVKNHTKDLQKKNTKSFNTNDWLLDNLLNKTYERNEVINMIIVGRIKHLNIDVDKLSKDELDKLINKLYKTSKNGLDTSVSDSNNNSSFSYNKKYEGYRLVKSGSQLSIEQVK